MGSLASVIRTGLGVVDDITVSGGLQVTISHRAYVTQDALGDGEPYAAAVSRTAVYVETKHMFHGAEGSEIQSIGKLLFPRAVVITAHDQITMPDGTIPPILEVKGMWDQGAAGRFYTSVELGQAALPRQQFGV